MGMHACSVIGGRGTLEGNGGLGGVASSNVGIRGRTGRRKEKDVDGFRSDDRSLELVGDRGLSDLCLAALEDLDQTSP